MTFHFVLLENLHKVGYHEFVLCPFDLEVLQAKGNGMEQWKTGLEMYTLVFCTFNTPFMFSKSLD